ncbi:flippase-like domain-containing protein [Aliirhizobium terrae]|nr:lysylphosphatidylglycerol synthase domain-containing protein [Rhizobium sp. CC-CFT758]WJH39454.1 flippase-like domain-containing protein [Rhizobium sp. CC-CFT758]
MTLLTLAIVILYAAFIQWVWGWGSVLALWEAAGLGSALAALLALLATYVLRTWRIYDYFPKETGGRFGTLLRLTQVHNLLNIMLPFRSGEASFPLLMKREFDLPLARGTAALFVMRLFDLHALLAAAGIGLVLQTGDQGGALWARGCGCSSLSCLQSDLRCAAGR